MTAARAEFDLVTPDLFDPTVAMYPRSDFLPLGESDKLNFDEGDFLGRGRTLFGPPNVPAKDGYVLRHKRTGMIVTLFVVGERGWYGAVPRNQGLITDERFAAWNALLAADPILAKGPPTMSDFPDETSKAFWDADRVYHRRLDDVSAGQAIAEAVARLDALMSAIKPAAWETTLYDRKGMDVVHVGARDGASFRESLADVPAIDWLLAHANTTTDRDQQEEYDSAVLALLRDSPELVGYRERARPSLVRFEAAAAAETDVDLRERLQQEAREYREMLR